MRSREEWEGDLLYEVWRSGGNPDAIDFESYREEYDYGEEPGDVAVTEIRRQAPRPTEENSLVSWPDGSYYSPNDRGEVPR